VLPENYYLSNFDALTRFVVNTYRETLTAEELLWATTVSELPESARRLYVRLLSRQGNTFRLGKLKYPEIDSLADAANALAEAGLASVNTPEELESILPLVTRPELTKLPELTDAKGLSRVGLDERLLELNSPKVLASLQALDNWIQILQGEIFELFVLCYFGNRYQDLTEFVLRDLGHQTFESYSIDENTRAFQTREHIDAHWQYFQCQAALSLIDVTSVDEITALNTLLPEVSLNSALSKDAHLMRRVGRFKNQLARQLERLQEFDAALTLYNTSNIPPSRERQVRILTKAEHFQDALNLTAAMLDSPMDDSESRFAERQIVTLKKKLGQRVLKSKPFRPTTTTLTLQITEENESDRVESRAMKYYEQSGRCYYAENALVRGVLGLFIWDIMFMPIDGAFHHPFQSGPSDLMQPEFMEKRQQAFTNRWHELDDSVRFAARVWQHWEDKQGVSNTLVHWSRLPENLLSDALIRIPVKHWQALFDRLLKDIRSNGKGLPDLVLFPEDGGYEFIEIKGPGDALQQHQRRWMQHFTQHGIPHRVVNVRYAQRERDA